MSTLERTACCAALVLAAAAPVRAQTDTPAAGGVEQLRGMSLEQLMNVEVTSVSRSESTVGESPAAIFVITQEMIRRSGATTIPELFRMVPGMDVAHIDGNKWAVSARGFNDRFAGKLLIQLDGRTIYNPIFAGVYWDSIDFPLEDIERIEVIRGPGASVWGANAVNGVINIITKSAKDTQGGMVSAGGGNEQRAFGLGQYGSKIGENAYYRVYGKSFNQDRQYSMQGDPHDGWWGERAGFRVDWTATDRDAVLIEGGVQRSSAGRIDLRPMASLPYVLTNIEDDVSTSGNVLGRWTRHYSADSSWTLQTFWEGTDRESDHDVLHLSWNIYDVDFQQEFAIGKRQKFIYGLGYRLSDITLHNSKADDGFIITWPEDDRHLQLFSAFVQDQITLVEDRLGLTLGSKLEHNDLTGFEVEPSARLLWTPSKNQSAWAAVSRAVRTPSMLEDDLRIKTLTTPGKPVFLSVDSNPDINSEELTAYELGYREQISPELSFDVATFFNEYRDLIGTRPGAKEVDPPLTISHLNRDNTLSGESYGVEPAVTWQATDWWRLYGAYTFFIMQLHRDAGLAPSAEAAEGISPQNQVYVQSSWDLPGHTEFDVMGRYVDEIHGFNPGKAPGVPDSIANYMAVDVRLAWKARKNLELSVVAQNLFDDHHPEFGTSTIIRSPIVELQRSIYGKVTWWF